MKNVVEIRNQILNKKIKFENLPKDLIENETFCGELLSRLNLSKKEIKLIPERFLNNAYFVVKIIDHNLDICDFLNEEIRNELLPYIQDNHPCEYARYKGVNNFKTQEDCINALLINKNNFIYLPSEFKKDKKICEFVLAFNGNFSQFLYEEKHFNDLIKTIPKVFFNDDGFCKSMLNINLLSLAMMPEKIKNDEILLTPILMSRPYLLKYAGDSIKGNLNLINKIIKSNRIDDIIRFSMFEFIDEKLFTESFCNENKNIMHDLFLNGSSVFADKKITENKILSVFKSSFFDDTIDDTLSYIKEIKNKNMKIFLINARASNNHKLNKDELVSLVKKYYLNIKLGDIKINEDVKQQKNKI